MADELTGVFRQTADAIRQELACVLEEERYLLLRQTARGAREPWLTWNRQAAAERAAKAREDLERLAAISEEAVTSAHTQLMQVASQSVVDSRQARDGQVTLFQAIRQRLALAGAAFFSYSRLRPSLRERLKAWRALSARLEGWAQVPGDQEILELQREYYYLVSWQQAMPLKVGLYQIGLMGMLTAGLFWLELSGPAKGFLLCGYFGALGAAAASLWGMVLHTSGRSLRPHQFQSHVLKPLLGAVLGVLVVLLLPNLIETEAPPAGSKELFPEVSATALALAVIAGLNERAFIHKVQDVAAAVLGRPEKKTSVQA